MYIKEKLELNYDFVPNADKFQILSVVLMNLSVNSKKKSSKFCFEFFFFLFKNFAEISTDSTENNHIFNRKF